LFICPRYTPAALLSETAGSAAYAEADPAALAAQIDDAARAAQAVSRLNDAGISISSFSMGQPTLDEVFFALTGRPAEPQEESPNADGATEKTP
jgi:ABC-2 type transport system ATP-binding protein